MRSPNFFGKNHDKKELKMVKFNHFGARTTPQSLVKVCCLWTPFLPMFWEFGDFFLVHNINLDLYFHIKSILGMKIDPMCWKPISNTPYLTSFRGFIWWPWLMLCFVLLWGLKPLTYTVAAENMHPPIKWCHTFWLF